MSEQASRICSHCGLCCNGSLYAVIPLSETDRSNLIAVAELHADSNGEPVWLQPCTAHNGSCCTVYDRRPTVCREYLCGVLDSVAKGSMTPEQAVLLVTQVKSLAQTLALRMNPADTQQPTRPLYQLLNDFDQQIQLLAPAEQRAVDPVLLITAGTLKIMLGKHFKVVEFLSENPDSSPAGAADERTP